MIFSNDVKLSPDYYLIVGLSRAKYVHHRASMQVKGLKNFPSIDFDKSDYNIAKF